MPTSKNMKDVQLPLDIHQALKVYAKKCNLSTNKLIELVLRDWYIWAPEPDNVNKR